MNKYEMKNILLDDIMTNITKDNNLDTIREALWAYLDVFTEAELDAELRVRGG
jgi:hypothetical protein